MSAFDRPYVTRYIVRTLGGPMAHTRRTVAVLSVLVVGCAAAAVALGARAERQAQAASSANRRVVSAAEAFLATLDAGQRAKANIDLNAKTRTIWSNLPTGITMQVGAATRNGLKLGDLTPVQEKAAMALVAAALSREGFE